MVPIHHHSDFVTGALGFSGSLGSIFTGGLGFVTVLLAGGMDQSFLSSKRLPDIFPVSDQEVLACTGAFSNGGGLFYDVKGFWLSEFTGALTFVWGGCTVSLPGSSLATTFTLYFFVGINLSLFYVALDSFLA